VANKAKRTKKSAPKAASDENVVRIRANSTPSSKEEKSADVVETKVVASKTEKAAKPAKAEKAVKVKKPRAKRRVRGGGVFRAIGGYFKGAWVELRQVRWPNRRATWSLTAAVLAYSAFFVLLVLLLDAAFKYLFELILGK
jgi:preprotein translocase subunit SecE